jgi:hypothetical protein
MLGLLGRRTSHTATGFSAYRASVAVPHPHDGLFARFSFILDGCSSWPSALASSAYPCAWREGLRKRAGILLRVRVIQTSPQRSVESGFQHDFVGILVSLLVRSSPSLHSWPQTVKTARYGTAKRGVAHAHSDGLCCSVGHLTSSQSPKSALLKWAGTASILISLFLNAVVLSACLAACRYGH